MTERMENIKNPFACIDSEELRKLLVDLMPSSNWQTPVDKVNEALSHVINSRFRKLPENTYRILFCGSQAGWNYKLELNGEAIRLRHPEIANIDPEILSNDVRIETLARQEIAKSQGYLKADMARFDFVFGFQI